MLSGRRLARQATRWCRHKTVMVEKYGCAGLMEVEERLPELAVGPRRIHHNLPYSRLRELEIASGECRVTSEGATAVDTGKFTGRSPNDKYLVADETSREAWWANNGKMSPEVFDELQATCLEHLGAQDEVFVFDGYAGASRKLKVRFVTAKAWQHHFVKNMFFRPKETPDIATFAPDFTVYNASGTTDADWRRHGLRSENFVALHLGKRVALVGGTEYTGEMKKGIFTVMNFLEPRERGALTMHCAANVGERGDVALLFGLSGTGKTTLSACPTRPIIGDDEHCWDDQGVSNIENGCYAKVIGLDPANEPLIHAAIKRNALLENVDLDDDGVVDYQSDRKTANTRVSYPMSHIPNRVDKGKAGHPTRIVFLACDAYGVLPPVARLDPDQAIYHFLSGYSSKLAGTELGVEEPVPVFSACFGAPFLPLHPFVYASLLRDKIRRHHVTAYLVNTGWAAGPVGVGSRMPIATTRAVVDAIHRDAFDHDAYTHHPILNLHVPDQLIKPDHRLPPHLLHPWASWASRDDYDAAADRLARLFVANYDSLYADHALDLSPFGPQPRDT